MFKRRPYTNWRFFGIIFLIFAVINIPQAVLYAQMIVLYFAITIGSSEEFAQYKASAIAGIFISILMIAIPVVLFILFMFFRRTYRKKVGKKIKYILKKKREQAKKDTADTVNNKKDVVENNEEKFDTVHKENAGGVDNNKDADDINRNIKINEDVLGTEKKDKKSENDTANCEENTDYRTAQEKCVANKDSKDNLVANVKKEIHNEDNFRQDKKNDFVESVSGDELRFVDEI